MAIGAQPRRPDVRSRRGFLTETDRAIWAEFSRQVAPLPGRVASDPPAALPMPNPMPETAPGPRPAPPPTLPRPALVPRAPLVVDRQPPGLDTGTWTRFRAGKLAPTRTLDLHGRTAQRSFHALADFLHRAASDQQRCVEVITGRGAGPEGGVLRRELPLWLNLGELRPLLLAAAHPHAANQGAVRLLLRRAR